MPFVTEKGGSGRQFITNAKYITYHNICVALITQITRVSNKNSNMQGRIFYLVRNIDFPFQKELLLKECIRSLWEQILSFKRGSHYEKGRN